MLEMSLQIQIKCMINFNDYYKTSLGAFPHTVICTYEYIHLYV